MNKKDDEAKEEIPVALDAEGVPLDHFEFGGSLGAASLMIGFPLLMWYMWAGAIYYDGQLPWPSADESWEDFLQHLYHLVSNQPIYGCCDQRIAFLAERKASRGTVWHVMRAGH